MKPKKKDDDCWEKGDPKDCGPKEKEPLFRPFNKGQFRFSIWYFLAAIVLIFLINSLIVRPAGEMVEFSQFKELIRQGDIKRVELGETVYNAFPYTRQDIEAARRHSPAEIRGVDREPLTKFSGLEKLQSRKRSSDDTGREGVGEKVWP